MKIAITGHTSGIGKAIKSLLEVDHQVLGFSRTNGYNINNPSAIFEVAKDCDVFINNAQHQGFQTELFELFWKNWRLEHKTIVNINSQSKYAELNAKFGGYVVNKQKLDQAAKTECLSVSKGVGKQNCRVTNMIVGWTDTPMISFLRHVKKMPPEKVASTVKWVLDQPQDIQIFELGIWHQNETIK